MATIDEAKAIIRDIGYKYSHNDELLEELKTVNDALCSSEMYSRDDVFDGEERWCDKYNKLREKYIDRFFNGGDEEEKTPENEPEKEEQEITIESLFKEE